MQVLYIVFNVLIAIAATAIMEFVAWFTHKYIMHGVLWVLHKDHHVPHKGHVEKNDLFVLFFATPAVLCLVFGIGYLVWPLISTGIGITLYGVGYTLFHDIMFHKRIKWLRIPAKWAYVRRIVNAHRNHHKSIDKTPGEAFGFLWVSRRYESAPKKSIGTKGGIGD